MLSDVRELGGAGVTALENGLTVALGSIELFTRLGIGTTAAPDYEGLFGVSRGRSFLGWLLLADKPRPEAKTALADLRLSVCSARCSPTGDVSVSHYASAKRCK